MKALTLVVLVTFVLMVSGCGHPKEIGGIKYKTIGIFQEESPSIHYEVSIGNVVWSLILFPTIIMPVYFIGWSIKNPMCRKADYIVGVGCR